ncbi:hypothetical protein [Chryseobacterium sp. RLHN22]|uniref:FEKKY domain-containing protein n=1 Tax=Chryseobacterium sp. RLHN22 TaxID=3437885 RepID=UPI003D9B49BA
MKKILYLNIILIILILVANVAIFYGINFPMPFDFINHFTDYETEYILIILLIIGLLAYLIASVKNKQNNFLHIFFILNCLFLAFLAFEGSSEYIKKKKELTLREMEYIKQAKKDIENDRVTYKFAGGLAVSDYDEEIEKKIDDIYKKYGVTYFNTGCIVDFMDLKAQKKYQETVKPYLIKRNGKNWELKMKSEIEKIRN